MFAPEVGGKVVVAVEFNHARTVTMPHRTTYFFPRQFPDRGFDASSSKFFQDHEKKITTANKDFVSGGETTKSSKETGPADTGNIYDRKDSSDSFSTVPVEKHYGFTGDRIHGKQLAAFVNWLADKKKKEKKSKTAGHGKIKLEDEEDDDEHEHLLPPPPEAVSVPEIVEVNNHRLPEQKAKDQLEIHRQVSLTGESYNYYSGGKESGTIRGGLERHTSLQRLSSLGSTSYAGSLFSGATTTYDGNWTISTGVKDTTRTREVEEMEVEEQRANVDPAVQKSKESYYLQLTFAKRLTEQANMASEPVLLLQEGRTAVSSDPLTTSYRLWVLALFQFPILLWSILLSRKI